MGRCYCVFWFPTIFHKELKAKKIKIVRAIDDNSSFKHNLELELLKQNNKEHIKITLTRQSVIPLEVILYLDAKSHNGFRRYYFDFPDDRAKEERNFRNMLELQIYHCAKEFYHSHEVLYGNEKECFLRAIIGTDKIDINSDDNPALLNFLEQFADRFEVHAEQISKFNSLVHSIENSLIESKSIDNRERSLSFELKTERKYKSKTRSIDQLCENTLIEYTYCKTLLTSIYNKSFHPIIPPFFTIYPPQSFPTTMAQNPFAKNDDRYRKLAINIENSIRYIECIKYKGINRANKIARDILDNLNYFNKNSKRNQKLNSLLAIYSVCLAVMSLTLIRRVFTTENWWSETPIYELFHLPLLLFFLIAFIVTYFKYPKKNNEA